MTRVSKARSSCSVTRSMYVERRSGHLRHAEARRMRAHLFSRQPRRADEEDFMSTVITVIVVAAVVVVALPAFTAWRGGRTASLRDRFGPEPDDPLACPGQRPEAA